jgi:pyrroloquinoline quinone (PQQ) biosynthesis protein C
MTPYDRLLAETASARARFLSIPLLTRALAGDVPQPLYLAFLTEAYHHVRHTCPLLSLAAAKTDDAAYRKALYAYIGQEQGHDEWILADIAAMGGDVEATSGAAPGPACQVMVGYAYYAIEWISPYALLGMVHVLEGISAELAAKAAIALRKSFGLAGDGGFSYLVSHGELDKDHTGFFRDLVNRLRAPSAGAAIIDCANIMYRLYGDIFRDLGRGA